MLIGNLGKDPEVRYTQDGKAVASFSIATTDKWKDKQTGQQLEKTEWHRIVAFGRLAEVCGEYLRKGSICYIEGKLQTRSWEKDGITRYTTEIIADSMKMFGSQQSPQNGNNYSGMQQQNAGQPGGYQQPEDNIPF